MMAIILCAEKLFARSLRGHCAELSQKEENTPSRIFARGVFFLRGPRKELSTGKIRTKIGFARKCR